MAFQRRCRNSSTSLDTVSRVFLGYLIIAYAVIELSIAPDQNTRLVPPHARKALLSKGLDLEGFVPLTKDEMIARLD